MQLRLDQRRPTIIEKGNIMSLIKQLWLGIIVLLLLALGGSFAISMIAAKTYLTEQLRLKNIDNVNSLALSMSQMEKDPVTIELLINAQFNAGHYEYIVFNDPNKKPIVARSYDETDKRSTRVPRWFSNLLSFDVAPGVAQVQDNWQQYGTLILKSHSQYAIEMLWKNTTQLFEWFLVATLLSGLLGSFILKYISRPLDMIINQAEAIGNRRFIISDEPKTTEFQRLVRAMNTLSSGVKLMLEKETQQLEILRRESQLDLLTGLSNRAHFLNVLETKLTREDSDNEGIIALARVLHLGDLNLQHGRAQVDQLLREIAIVFHQTIEQYPESQAGRLNGSDFAIVIPTNITLDVISAEISHKLNFQLISSGFQHIALPLALCSYTTGEARNELMHKLDGALAQAELKGNRAVIALNNNHTGYNQWSLNEWRESLTRALDNNQIALAKFPVKYTNGDLLHLEGPVRLELDNGLKPAGYFMPWAARLGMLPTIDLSVLQAALKTLDYSLTPLAINVSADALCNARFREQAIKLLQNNPSKTSDLWIEFPEICVVRHLEEFRGFSSQLRTLGCRVGLEHVGLEFTQFNELQDMGLHYLKVDSAIIHDIHLNTGNQTFLQGLCTVGHSLGILMIAEGVNSKQEITTLIKLGVDALTGPGIQ